jgi:uridine kinase
MRFADLIIPEGGENKVAIDIIAGKIVNLLNRQ